MPRRIHVRGCWARLDTKAGAHKRSRRPCHQSLRLARQARRIRSKPQQGTGMEAADRQRPFLAARNRRRRQRGTQVRRLPVQGGNRGHGEAALSREAIHRLALHRARAQAHARKEEARLHDARAHGLPRRATHVGRPPAARLHRAARTVLHTLATRHQRRYGLLPTPTLPAAEGLQQCPAETPRRRAAHVSRPHGAQPPRR